VKDCAFSCKAQTSQLLEQTLISAPKFDSHSQFAPNQTLIFRITLESSFLAIILTTQNRSFKQGKPSGVGLKNQRICRILSIHRLIFTFSDDCRDLLLRPSPPFSMIFCCRFVPISSYVTAVLRRLKEQRNPSQLPLATEGCFGVSPTINFVVNITPLWISCAGSVIPKAGN
jgi:hypothetical protein